MNTASVDTINPSSSDVQALKVQHKGILRVVSLLMAASLSLSSDCWAVAAAGAGTYGGYKMKEQGYTLQNPITKEKKSRK